MTSPKPVNSDEVIEPTDSGLRRTPGGSLVMRVFVGFSGCVAVLCLWWILTLGENNSLKRFNPWLTFEALGVLFTSPHLWDGMWESN